MSNDLTEWLKNGEMAQLNEGLLNNRGPGKRAIPVGNVNKRQGTKRTDLENDMQAVVDTALSQFPHLAKPETEYRFHKTRQWRFDFAWPDYVLAIEAEGGTWLQTTKGFSKGHAHPKRFEDDCEKYNEAALDGWMVLRFTGDMIKDGRALAIVLAALNFIDATL